MPTRVLLGLLLAWAPTAAAAAPPRVAVLYSHATPAMRAALPAAACDFYEIEGFRAPRRPADTVVLAGHSLPPFYLDRPAPEVGRAIAAFHPRLVVLDTCYGASTPLLGELAAALPGTWVVAPPFRIPKDGFVYGPGFLGAGDPAARARAVRTEPAFPLLRWRLEPARLAALGKEIDALDPQALRKRLKRVRPALVAMPLPTALDAGGMVLVPVPVDRFKARP